VEFMSKEAQEQAVAMMNGMQFRHQTLSVAKSDPPNKSSSSKLKKHQKKDPEPKAQVEKNEHVHHRPHNIQLSTRAPQTSEHYTHPMNNEEFRKHFLSSKPVNDVQMTEL
jgi:hypothetical protein